MSELSLYLHQQHLNQFFAVIFIKDFTGELKVALESGVRKWRWEVALESGGAVQCIAPQYLRV
jgi:hypothetical protein